MDSKTRRMAKELRGMSSANAATWIMDHYRLGEDGWGQAIILISKRSWSRPDQVRLAKYYLAGIPYASERAYSVFAEIMGVRRLLNAISDFLPYDPSRIELLLYYLVPALTQAAKSEKDHMLIADFVTTLVPPEFTLDRS
jgi:hypothetical protein